MGVRMPARIEKSRIAAKRSRPAMVSTLKLSATGTLEEAQRLHILQTLQQTEGVVGGPNGAAARLGLERTTLISKMKRLGIHRGQGSVLPVRAVAAAEISAPVPASPDMPVGGQSAK
jgi:DNA-binding NtrC family response regulator